MWSWPQLDKAPLPGLSQHRTPTGIASGCGSSTGTTLPAAALVFCAVRLDRGCL